MSGAEKLFDAVTEIRDDLIEEAQRYVFPERKIPYRRIAAMAACLVVIVGLTAAMRSGIFRMGSNSSDGMSGDTNGAGWIDGSEDADRDENAATGESAPPEAAESTTFTAVVLEIHDSYLLVEPLEGEAVLSSADRIEVPTGELENLPELQTGDQVAVTFSGEIQETYPARLTEVLSVERMEPAS